MLSAEINKNHGITMSHEKCRKLASLIKNEKKYTISIIPGNILLI